MLFNHDLEAKRTILIVDDEPASLMILEDSITDLANVITAKNGTEAIEKATQFLPDVILLDIELPDINGFEVCINLKNNPRICNATVIFVTSHSGNQFEHQSLELGGIDFIQKPIDLRICRLRIKNHLKMKQQEALLCIAEKDLHTLVSQVPVYISYWSKEFINLFNNDFSGQWFIKKTEQSIGRFSEDILPAELNSEIILRASSNIEKHIFEVKLETSHNKIEHVQAHLNIGKDENGIQGILLTLTDITSIKQAKKSLATESERLRVTLNSIGDAVIATDEHANITFMNPIAERMTGWVIHQAIGKHIDQIMNLCDATTKHKGVNPIVIALQEKRIVAMALNCQLTSLDGRIYRVEDSAAPIRDDEGQVIGGIIVFHDVSESIAMAVKMSHLANHDQLTDLPNRILLHDRVSRACYLSTKNGLIVALMLIDIDHFKYLNDTLGHHHGDLIIKQVAKRLESIVDVNTTLARVGGDEYVLLLPDLKSANHVDAVAADIVHSMNQPFRIEGEEFNLSVSIGISINPTDSRTAEEMMAHADAAMYKAKEQGRNRFCYYSDDLEKLFHQRQSIDKLLRAAIENNSLEIFYQPKLKLSQKEVVGAEALVRLRDNVGHLISPIDFIPLAEETGLIHALGHDVLKKSCIAAKRWLDKGKPLKIAVNIAAKQFSNPKFTESVAQVLEETQLPSRYLELEVTESALMHNFDDTIKTLNDLCALGLTIAIDDFGTGYSSLSYLKLFPVDVLKIDQSFVRDMVSDDQSKNIVQAITHLAHSLNLQLVGEGIEEQAHLDMLIKFGCQEGQGYLFSRPLPEAEFEALYVFTQ
ncbi:diguanylate cyclase [Pseudoalteromonas porphyrae]|uniref:EAL domain-containing protein n=1 Tax=Pseudoalteromonas porphyrae TaxID=187330 RepID=UPI0006BAC6E2|nr:EAL domain-containing protein [Pseudoalteromonas porphyrae]KPH94261.1 diguanylate cyclase [Pseudoalteromonas porphyrae]